MRPLLVAALAALLVGTAHGAGTATSRSRIAFGLERGGASSIYTVRPDGSGLRRLTVPPTRQELGGDSGPVWSPNGRRIVFERDLTYWAPIGFASPRCLPPGGSRASSRKGRSTRCRPTPPTGAGLRSRG